MLGFSVGLLTFLTILAYFVGFVIIQTAANDMDYAVISASRAAVVCDNMDSATERATEIANEVLQRNGMVSDIRVDVRYTPGSEQEWKKGNYIDVAVICKVHTIAPLVDDERHAKETIMIEHR